MSLIAKTAMVLLTTWPLSISLPAAQVGSEVAQLSPEVQQHLRDLAHQLPPASQLRQQLLNGAHGDGVRRPWMDDMRRRGIKRVVVWVSIDFNSRGRPRKMKVERTEYFTEYEDHEKVSDRSQLDFIRNGLQEEMASLALQKAARGVWLDRPRPKPHPFIGAAKMEFFDDEWLPTLNAPIFCAGRSCLD